MKRSTWKWIITGLLLIMVFSCSREEQEDLDLGMDYLHVSDVSKYCQGPCGDVLDWEEAVILVMGHIPDVENEASMNEAFTKKRFFLHDIRNGMFIKIMVTGDEDAVFQLLGSLTKQDEVFIQGRAQAVIVNDSDECVKGLVVNLDSSGNIKINL